MADSKLSPTVLLGLLAVCLVLVGSASCDPMPAAGPQPDARAHEEPLDAGIFPVEIICKEDEELKPLLPQCEPTCENERPPCPKMFIMDGGHCFCRAPKLRNKAGQCVPKEQC